MAETTLQLGFVPKNRGEYQSTPVTRYYKDNVVQYNGSSYIADPVGWSEDHPTDTYVTIAPTDASGNLNAGWRVFASGNNTFTTGEKVDNVGIDSEPTAGSNNLVKSGGVKTYVDGHIIISQNISTGHTEINIGDVVNPVASVAEVEETERKVSQYIKGIDLFKYTITLGYITGLGTTNTWDTTIPTIKHIVVPIADLLGASKIKIMNGANQCRLAFLSSYSVVNGQSANVISYKRINANATEIVDVPVGAQYLYFFAQNGTTVHLPNLAILSDDIEVTMHTVDILDKMVYGVLDAGTTYNTINLSDRVTAFWELPSRNVPYVLDLTNISIPTGAQIVIATRSDIDAYNSAIVRSYGSIDSTGPTSKKYTIEIQPQDTDAKYLSVVCTTANVQASFNAKVSLGGSLEELINCLTKENNAW